LDVFTKGGLEMATSKNKREDSVEKDQVETAKYGIADLAEALDIEPASARIRLRNAEIKKRAGRYGWNTKAELDEVVKKLTPKSKDKE